MMFKETLKQLEGITKIMDNLSKDYKSQINTMVDSLSPQDKEIYEKFAKESGVIIGSNKDLASKLNELNALKDKYANGNSNK